MATNPLNQANTGANGATAPTNPVNDPNKPLKRRYNRFPLSHSVLNTLRYGDITPFLAFEGVEGDRVPFSSKHEIRSYTLSAPLMSEIKMNKDYFLVPMQAILPLNWEKIYVNPTQGDDVPDNANCVINDILPYVEGIATSWMQFSIPSETMRRLLLAEMFLSNGSLLSCFNIHLSRLAEYPLIDPQTNETSYVSFDRAFDAYMTREMAKFKVTFYHQNASVTYCVGHKAVNPNEIEVSLHYALERMRNDPFFTISDVVASENAEALPRVGYYTDVHINKPVDPLAKFPLNFSRPLAYQLAVAHFYTNDKVDFLYSAELYRQNQLALATYANENDGVIQGLRFFEYNGVPTQYDALSGIFLQMLLDDITYVNSATAKDDDNRIGHFAYYFNILGFRQSLRFGDYFTGGRPSPLAVGDVSAPVVDASVSAIDMTKNIMMQRFLNAVNRVGRKFGDYVKDIMDGAPSPTITDPKFLAHTQSYVSGFEVENTASEQGNVTTNLKSHDSNFAFEVSVENPCIILGLASFDIKRIYSQTITKFATKENRFDMFNPYMQYIGDQEIASYELGIGHFERFRNFAYTLRHMEYKQAINYACGGFVENLPAWAFITDNESSGTDEVPDAKIDPVFIRSSCAELDRFYSSLTGKSDASYFHFIVKFDNELNPARAMEFAPTIL